MSNSLGINHRENCSMAPCFWVGGQPRGLHSDKRSDDDYNLWRKAWSTFAPVSVNRICFWRPTRSTSM